MQEETKTRRDFFIKESSVIPEKTSKDAKIWDYFNLEKNFRGQRNELEQVLQEKVGLSKTDLILAEN